MTARAHAPGHVSGLFAIHDEPEEPLRKGSRGAGWCVDRGATATAMPSERPRLRVDGAEGEWEVTRRALHILAPRQAMDVDVRLELPVGQGFGMSAAGTLAACLAAASELGLEPEAALEATHQAEVEAGGGLGDAVAAWHGSAEVRMRPGCPPHGWVSRVEPPPGTRLLYCVLGDPLPTRSVIREPSWKLRTRALADNAVDRIVAARREGAWQALLEESARFSQELGLLTPRMRAAGDALPADVPWGQCMLGSTLWCAPDAASAADAQAALRIHGRTFALGVPEQGARLVR